MERNFEGLPTEREYISGTALMIPDKEQFEQNKKAQKLQDQIRSKILKEKIKIQVKEKAKKDWNKKVDSDISQLEREEIEQNLMIDKLLKEQDERYEAEKIRQRNKELEQKEK